jgi:hypothetical protein
MAQQKSKRRMSASRASPGMLMLGELVDGCLHGVLYWLRQLGVVVKEILIDRKPRHRKRLQTPSLG